MTRYIKYIKIFVPVVLSLILFPSCSDDSSDGGANGPGSIGGAVNSVSTDWLAPRSEVRARMKGYNMLGAPSTDVDLFENAANGYLVAYEYENDLLLTSAIMIPSGGDGIDADAILKSYAYVGDIDGGRLYADTDRNTMACYWEAMSGYSDYAGIGFTPVTSHILGTSERYGVTTGDVSVTATTARFNISIKGDGKVKEAGVEFGSSPEFKSGETRTVSKLNPTTDLSLSATGILGELKYYYSAYAVIDGAYYYGETKSFDTQQLTYSIDGQIYRMIKVEGGPYGDFLMMQTEVIPSKDITVGEHAVRLDKNQDKYIIKAELREFLYNLQQKTGLAWRMPTSQEWKLAAGGGALSKGFVYAGSNDAAEVAWHSTNATSAMSPGLLKANELGFYDMSGNYSELTNDAQLDALAQGKYFTASSADWSSSRCYGGNWSKSASGCTIESSFLTPGVEKNKIDARYYTLRLVISCDASFDASTVK